MEGTFELFRNRFPFEWVSFWQFKYNSGSPTTFHKSTDHTIYTIGYHGYGLPKPFDGHTFSETSSGRSRRRVFCSGRKKLFADRPTLRYHMLEATPTVVPTSSHLLRLHGARSVSSFSFAKATKAKNKSKEAVRVGHSLGWGDADD